MADASAWKVELEAEGDAWKAKQDAHAEQTARHVDEIAELYTLVGQAPAGNPNSLDTARDCLTAGSGTAYTATFAPAFTSLVNGIELKVRWHTDSGENPTLDLDGQGPRGIVRPDGGAPEATALKANYTGKVVYNATLDKWVLVSNIPQAPPIATLSAKSSDYSIQAEDLRAVTIVPIDISGQSVDIKELALASMTGLVRYVVSAWDGAGATYKARVIDASDAEVATLYAEGDFVDIAYDGTGRVIAAEQVTAEGHLILDADFNQSTSPGDMYRGSTSWTLHHNIGGLYDDTTNYRLDLPFDCLIEFFGVARMDNDHDAYFKISANDATEYVHVGEASDMMFQQAFPISGKSYIRFLAAGNGGTVTFDGNGELSNCNVGWRIIKRLR